MSVSRLSRPDTVPRLVPRFVPLRSRTGAALITATVLASATTAVDANVVKVAVPAAPSAGLLIAGRVVPGIVGGWLADAGSWRTVFLLNVPLILGSPIALRYVLLLAPVSGALVARVGPRWLMTGGILFVAGGFGWLSTAQPGQGYAASILPGVLLSGLGMGLAVTPLTAAVLAAVGDADLGEASGINDAASRIGGVVVIALVPVLIGATGSRGYASALAGGYQPAMIVMAGLCVAAALITALVVTDGRTGHRADTAGRGSHRAGWP